VQWLLDWVQATCAWVLEIVSRPEGSKGFVLLPRHWVVERTFGWLSHYRVLSKDYEVLPRNSEAVVYVAMIHLMVRRLARHPTPAPS
jgi:putative transposase